MQFTRFRINLKINILVNKKQLSTLGKSALKFVVQVDVPAKEVNQIYDEYNRDEDIIKRDFVTIEKSVAPNVCSLDDEFKPPSERPSVKLMIELGRAKPRFTKIWNPKTGLDFYPFHR